MNKVIFLCTFLFSTFSWASCPGLSLADLPTVVNLTSNISPRINFRVSRQDLTTTCDYAVGFDRGSTPNYFRKLNNAGNTLDFTMSKRSNLNSILKDYIDANNKNEYIKGKFKSSKKPRDLSKDFTFFSEVTLNSGVPAGYYADSYLVKLYQEINGAYQLHETKSIVFYYSVPSQVALSIVNTNQAFNPLDTSQDVNFGTLTQGEVQGFDVVVQTTNGYSLKISSLNKGKLKHFSSENFINYFFKVNNQLQSLANSYPQPVQISSESGAHPGDGFRIPISFEVGDPTNKPSGTYADMLTITVTSSL